ncbi:TonB-dependent receptor [bacterium]|nr:MAG: TonB-dependent receptor [bacterium]
MKLKTPFYLLLFTCLFCFGFLQNLYAQSTGVIKGQIIDAETKETLPGVNILIKGTSFGGATDIDGLYEIRAIRPGEYSLEISYIGYERKLYTGIQVKAGEETVLNVELAVQVLTADEEVVVVGEKPIFDVEKSNSSFQVSASDIQAAAVRKIDDVVGLQAGVVKDPTGIYIKGGRAYETGYVVDGVSAQDPLAGTGFGLDLGSNSFQNVEVVTGGVGAEYGDVTSGVVAVQTQDGGEKFSGYVSHKRDNFGDNNLDQKWNFFTDVYELNFGGPLMKENKVLPGTMSFFVSTQTQFTDEFTKNSAENVQSSLIDSDFWSPRQDNRWAGMFKLTWKIKPTMKLQISTQNSLTINQNTRMLQITGNDSDIRPGYQFFFSNDLDNANTYTHKSNLSYVKWTHTLDEKSFYEVQFSRLFTRLRADANGRYWRPDSVDGEFDAYSIVTPPINEFQTGQDFLYVLQGPGFANNGGIAALWHDHYAEEITLKSTYTRFFAERTNRLTIGFETKFQDYQWIDITRPWVGAPIQIGPNEFSESLRLGQTSDIWQVEPRRGAVFANNQIRYKGLIANIGLRLEYWFPGDYVDKAVANPDAPIPQEIRDMYMQETYELFGSRFKMRLLPKLSVSFPVRENQVLFFNYGHSTRVPHPTFVYAGLDPFYQDRSFLSDLGNPNLNPEVDISYEIGLRNQITSDDALSFSAFWRDKYDFITTESITLPDATGRETTRAFRINGDYARVRGIDITYFKRYSYWFQGQLAVSYSRAEGLSSSNNEALQNILVNGNNIGNNVETPLAWDRPWDIKTNMTFTHARKSGLFNISALNDMRANVSTVWRSGIRYTPYIFRGNSTNPVSGALDWRPIYERDPDPAKRNSESGDAWFYTNVSFQKWFKWGKTRWTLSLDINNIFNNENSAIINPVTGKAYKTSYPTNAADLIALRADRSYDVPVGVRDPRYVDPRDNSLPAYLNPANLLEQRHIMFGLSVNF